MATSAKPSLAAAATTMTVTTLLLLLMAIPMHVGADSTITFFELEGCSADGEIENDWVCDTCHNITLHGGYQFNDVNNETVNLYDEYDCAGTPSVVLTESTWSCYGVTQKSMLINCTHSSMRGTHSSMRGIQMVAGVM